MPRQSRLDAPGALHHVMARGIERGLIFRGPKDYDDFLERLDSLTGWGGWTVFAWSLIPNHFHLVVRTGPVPLAAIMRRLMTGYAVAFNRRHGRHGHGRGGRCCEVAKQFSNSIPFRPEFSPQTCLPP